MDANSEILNSGPGIYCINTVLANCFRQKRGKQWQKKVNSLMKMKTC